MESKKISEGQKITVTRKKNNEKVELVYQGIEVDWANGISLRFQMVGDDTIRSLYPEQFNDAFDIDYDNF